MKSSRVVRRSERGVIILMATGIIFVLIAFLGLAFDVGFLQWQRRRAQTAADAAAMGGAWARALGGAVTAKGQASSAMNGFTDGASGISVTINNPPTVGAYTGDATAVEAIVSQDAPSYFSRILNWNSLPVRARAVAKLGFDQACVFALNPNQRDAIKFTGTVNVSFGCGVVSESNDSRATTINGNATITMNNGATIASVGGTNLGSGTVLPAPSTDHLASGVNNPGDPLSGMAVPIPDAAAYCFDGTTMVTGQNCSGLSSLAGGSYGPGVYCGGITINSGVNVSFSPGVYILAGRPGLTINTGGTVSGTGVTFYLTDTTGWPCTGLNGSNGNAGAVTINGQATVHLSAPTVDPYAGMLLIENPSITNVPHSDITAGSGSTIDGVIYMPHTDLSFSGGSSTDAGYLMILADTLEFAGNASFSLNHMPDAFANNNPAFKKWVTMAE